MVCLPVSQWNEETYQSYAEEGGSGGWVEQGWTGDEVPRRMPRTKADSQEMDEDEADSSGVVHYRTGMGEANAGAERPRAEMNPMNAAGEQEGGGARIRVGVDSIPPISEEELARRRKCKGIQSQSVGGPRFGGGTSGPWLGGGLVGPTHNSSGSDSCDPLERGAHLYAGPVSSDDADSGIGPGGNTCLAKDKPILISGGSDEDVDLGGEGGGSKEAVTMCAPKVETVVVSAIQAAVFVEEERV